MLLVQTSLQIVNNIKKIRGPKKYFFFPGVIFLFQELSFKVGLFGPATGGFVMNGNSCDDYGKTNFEVSGTIAGWNLETREFAFGID